MEKSPSILFVEDNQQIADQVIKAGVHYKWSIDWVTNRDGAIEKALSGKFDILILDRMLGDGKDSIELINDLREQEFNIPTIILSSIGGAFERSNGLNAGADIYVEKPFVEQELIAAVNALLRRYGFGGGAGNIFQYGPLELRLYSRKATWEKSELFLSPLSFTLLEILTKRQGQIISRQELWKEAWPAWHADPQNDVMDQAIFRLRKEITKTTEKIKIITKRYRGFHIEISD